jgi:hypothetical protein
MKINIQELILRNKHEQYISDIDHLRLCEFGINLTGNIWLYVAIHFMLLALSLMNEHHK